MKTKLLILVLLLPLIACAQSGGVWLNFDGTLKTGFKVGKNGGELKYNAATKAYYLKVPKNGGGYDSLYIVLSSWAAGPYNYDINVSQSVFADSLAAIRNKINLKASTNVVNRQGDSLATAYAQILLESGIRDSVDGALWASLSLKVSAGDVYSLLEILPDSVKIQSKNIILNGSVIADSLRSKTITAPIIQTASSGTRVRINGASNQIEFLNSSGTVVSTLNANNSGQAVLTGSISGGSGTYISADGITGTSIWAETVLGVANGSARTRMSESGLFIESNLGAGWVAGDTMATRAYARGRDTLVKSWVAANYATASAFGSLNTRVTGLELAGYLTSESDPTIYSWAKASSKPSYSWSEISSKPSFATVATSGSYNDLSSKPDLSSYLTYSTQSWRAGTITNIGTGLATSGTSIVLNYDNSSIKINAYGQAEVDGYNKTNWNTAYGWGNHASAGYIVNPTNAHGFLVNDGFGSISWGGSTYIQDWMDNNFDINDYTGSLTGKSGTYTIEDGALDQWAFTFTHGILTSIKKNGTEQ